MTQPLDSTRARELIKAAKGGDRDAMGELLAAYRSYLGTTTEAEIDGALGARVDSSDIVQLPSVAAWGRMQSMRGTLAVVQRGPRCLLIDLATEL